MKILYFTQFLSTAGGGGDVVFTGLAKGMIKLGHEVHIICHKMTNQKADNLPGAIIHKVNPVIQDRAGYLLSVSEHIMFILNAFFIGSSVIRKHKIDLIHANMISPIVPAALSGKLWNVPVLTTVHDVYSVNSPDYWKKWASQGGISRISSIFAPIYEKAILRIPVEAVHAVSDATKEDMAGLNPRANISVIYNGIEPNGPDIAVSYENFVLYIGRLIITKNLETVILAFRNVIQKLPDAKLVIVGEGPMHKTWEKLVSDNNLANCVEFQGYVTDETKNELLARCSALVFPSMVEGFGLVILEAFAKEKPVLVADIEPFDEIISDGVDGFLLPPHDSLRWAEEMIRLLTNKKLCERVGQNGKRKLHEKFSASVLNKKMEQLYIQLSAKRK